MHGEQSQRLSPSDPALAPKSLMASPGMQVPLPGQKRPEKNSIRTEKVTEQPKKGLLQTFQLQPSAVYLCPYIAYRNARTSKSTDLGINQFYSLERRKGSM